MAHSKTALFSGQKRGAIVMFFSEKILNEYREHADRRVAFVCRLMIGLMVLVAVLNYLGVFIIKPIPLNATVVVSILIYLVPTLLYSVPKFHCEHARFFILTLLVFQSGLLYAVLSYHTILMLVFPLVLSCLYNEKRYVIYTAVLSIPMLVLSHLAAFCLKIVRDEPLTTLRSTILYGILPRSIEYLAIFIICLYISDRIERLVATLARKNEELYEDQENLIFSLSNIIENKSDRTGQHIKRVSEYTRVLCQSLGYNDEECWKISLAAMMHDVGKLMIPDSILEKPGKLTNEEFSVIKKHTDYGKQMLESSPGELFTLSTQIAHQHHEKWDGSGYHGIQGEDIARCARCVSLADVFDALVSRRSYKGPWTPQQACAEIVAQKGKQFDPEVVDAFVQNFDKFVEITNRYPDEPESCETPAN